MINNLKDETLIICPNSYKKDILEYLTNNKLIINIKIMTFNEYLKNYYFDYDIKAIKYLHDKYNMKIDNAKEFLSNFYYVEDKKYFNEKLDDLVNKKRELDDNDLLIYNPYFKKYLKWEKVVYGYGQIDEFMTSTLMGAHVYNYKPINVNGKYKLLHAKDINEECENVFNRIIDLLNKGIDINKIFLMNVDNEYYPYLKRFSKYYGISINIPNNEKIIGTVLGTTFYQMILDHKNREEIYKYLEAYKEEDVFPALLGILNKYVEYDLYDVSDLIYDELLNTSVPSKKYKNVINIKDVFDKVNDDEYIFLMNFNNKSIPKLYKDTDYITDNIKDLVHLSNTNELNRISRENTLDYISSINNLLISYKDRSPFNEYYPSILLDSLEDKIEEVEVTKSYNYSNNYNKALFIEKLDNLVKYGEYDKDLEKLYKTYGNLGFQEYDNSFTNIDGSKILKSFNNKLMLSYTDINSYYECAFKYYLMKIMKVNLYDHTSFTAFGDIFHKVLKDMDQDGFDFDKSYQDAIDELKEKYEVDFTVKEKFYLDKLKPDLLFIINTINEFKKYTGLNKELHEKELVVPIMNNPEVNFKGYVDKIMYGDYDNKTLVSVIDYKTGKVDINMKLIEYGLSMQLPVYIYLIKKSNLFINPYIVGFYLEHILDNEIKRDSKKSYEELKKDNLKLTGYSIDNLDYLSIFDSTYEDSKMIRNMKLTKSRTIHKDGHPISEDEIEKIIDTVDKNIKDAVNNIISGKFPINPKIIKDDNKSCEYCKFKEICYLSEQNKIYIDTEEGDEDVDA